MADAKGLEPILEPDLIEQDFGAWDGLNFAQVKQRFPQDFKAWWADPGQPPTDGEHLNAVSQRVHGFFKQLDPQKGQTIGLVGHGSAFQALLCCLYSIPTRGLWPFRLQNATVTEVQFLHGMPTMTRMSWAGDHKEN